MKLSERLYLAAKIHSEIGGQAAMADTIREAAELARRVEDAEVAHVEPKNGTAVLHERCLPLAMIGQRVRLVPDYPTPPHPTPQEVPDGGR